MVFQARSYLPKEPLKELFLRWARETPELEPTRIHISLRALEKIFATRLGGSVAQVVTSGFETWPWLRQPLVEKYFSMSTSRTEPLASQELIFGISERVCADGSILKDVDLESLQFIAAKLKLMNVQKVCLNLLFSHINPSNQNKVRSFLQEEGFEVFCRPRLEKSTDEVTAWRTNILNACLSGTFLEMEKEIREALKQAFPSHESVTLHYVNSSGQLETNPLQNISGILFGWSGLLPEDKSILHLGLEKWSWIAPEMSSRWKSPWGSVEVPHREFQSLPVQPGSLLEKDFFEQISWGSEQSFEPGPMSFGRSQKPLLIDVLLQSLSAAKDALAHVVSTQGESRFREALHLLQKSSGARSLAHDIFKGSLQLSLLYNTAPEVLLSGFWSEYLLESYQDNFPNLNFKLLSTSHFEEAYSAAKLS
jgi:hypothetical protein